MGRINSRLIADYRRTILAYFKKYHNRAYTNCPSNNTIETDIFNLLESMNDVILLSNFRDCKSTKDRLRFFHQYLITTVDPITLLPLNRQKNIKKKKAVCRSTKYRPIESRKITQSWVDGKISKLEGDDKWRAVRYQALKAGGGKCCLCGRSAHDGIKLHVDHIKPKSIFPELIYNIDNLQVLCDECNLGKCNYDDTDWRQQNKLTSTEIDKIIESKQWEKVTDKPKYFKRKKHDAEFKPIEDNKYITIKIKTGVTNGRFR